MKKILITLLAAVALCGCSGHSHKGEEAHEEHVHTHDYTAYTHKAEFFLQHEGLEVGKKACITLYATDLSNFKPLQAGEATVLLRVGGKSYTATACGEGKFHFELTGMISQRRMQL